MPVSLPGCGLVGTSTPARRTETSNASASAVPPSSLTTSVTTFSVPAPSSSVIVHVAVWLSARVIVPPAQAAENEAE